MREPRYKCPDCQDLGYISILHPHCVDAIGKGRSILTRTVTVRCPCEASKVSHIPLFGSEWWHVKAHQPDTESIALGKTQERLFDGKPVAG